MKCIMSSALPVCERQVRSQAFGWSFAEQNCVNRWREVHGFNSNNSGVPAMCQQQKADAWSFLNKLGYLILAGRLPSLTARRPARHQSLLLGDAHFQLQTLPQSAGFFLLCNHHLLLDLQFSECLRVTPRLLVCLLSSVFQQLPSGNSIELLSVCARLRWQSAPCILIPRTTWGSRDAGSVPAPMPERSHTKKHQ